MNHSASFHEPQPKSAELHASITAVGLRNPVVMDEEGNVIDGHERRSICEELGLDWLAGADVRIGLTEIQKKALAIELNLWRRPIHLTQKQRNELLDVYLMANPHLSEPQVAELFCVNQSTVNRRKRELMRQHKLPKVVATVGKDGRTRRVGERRKQPARIIVKSRAEYESLKPALAEVGDNLTGLVRRPKRIHALAERKKSLREVNEAPVQALPADIQIEHCDFRNLRIEPGSVDVILTDVLWSPNAEHDWKELARLAKTWLRPNGLFCSIIGNFSWPHFCRAVMDELHYQLTIKIDFSAPTRSYSRNIVESWRPAPVFARSDTLIIEKISDTITIPGRSDRDHEKQYHDWQQPLSVAEELLRRLSKPGSLIVDPHLGT